MTKLPFVHWPSVPASFGLLILRIIFGSGLALHGWPKIQNPFGWMGADSWAPGFLQALAAVSEVAGGIALVVGLLTPIAALFVSAVMVVAASTVHIPAGQPFIATGGQPSSELAALYFGAAVTLLTTGPGRVSLDYLLFGKNRVPAASA